MALSKDGKTELQNRACIEFLSMLPASEYGRGHCYSSSRSGWQREQPQKKDADETNHDEEEWLPSANDSVIVVIDKVERELGEAEWALLNCARLGLTQSIMSLMMKSTLTGERRTIEVSTKVVRANGGYGAHIGGFCSFRIRQGSGRG
ncbi:hypothetical protein CBS101457_005699 [Exobasidium rhododendri]|nr:hypothetical protein CBS101457_005699 [Exobasidium rhododendri]